MKNIQFKWSTYFLQTLCCIYVLLTPLLLCYFYDIYNPNNTTYNIDIISKHFLKVSSVVIFLSYLITVPFLFLAKLPRIIYLVLLSITLYTSSIIDFIHVLLFKSSANSSSYYSIFSSNQSEVTEFILDYSTMNILWGLLLFMIAPFLSYLLYKKLKSLIVKKAIAGLFALVFISASFLVFAKSDINFYKEVSAYKFYSDYYNYKEEIKLLGSPDKKHDLLKVQHSPIQDNETYIIVIGESTSKFHMQLYGYERNTTPELSKLKDELTIFSNVKSSNVHTIESVKDMFILTDSNNNFTTHTLIDCFNNAGFSTYWLSNQAFMGKNETPVSAISKRTDKQFFINASGSNKLDGALLPELSKILDQNESKKVIFVHLMGTHLNYQDRYPNEFNVFEQKNISPFGDHADSHINQYDNAILYNDFVVSEIIKKVKSVKGLSTVVYLSDHGDEVYDFRDFHGHSMGLLSKYMNSVPFFAWSNGPFKELKEEQMIHARNNEDVEFSLKNLANSIQDLFGIHSEYYDVSKSFFSEKQIALNKSDTLDSNYIDLITELPDFNSKIWVHRVNSLERLKQIQDKFEGMEIDVVFKNGAFDVRHPPVKTIGLSLDKFLSNVENPSLHYFWLDLKDMTEANLDGVIKQLNFLSDKYHIKDNLIVETNEPKTIQKLNQNGYLTSYYLPDFSSLNESDAVVKLKTVHQNISKSQPKAISQSIDNYHLMSENFGKQNKLIWALNLDWNDPTSHQRIELLLKKDPSIKVCLVNYKTKGWK